MFKQELDLTIKDFEQFTKIKANVTQYENRIAEVQRRLQDGEGQKQKLTSEIM